MSTSYDVEFAHAVRRACSALTVKKGFNPMVDGAELAEMLLSDMPIERPERELLAELVTGKLCRRRGRPANECDAAPFVRAVRRAAQAMRVKLGFDAEKEGGRLAESLLGCQILGAGERTLLADFVTGQLRKGTRGAPQKGPGQRRIVAAIERFHQHCAEGLSRAEALERCGVEKRTMENWLQWTAEREKAVRLVKD